MKYFPIIGITISIILLTFYSNSSLNSLSSNEFIAPSSLLPKDTISLPQFSTMNIEIRNKSLNFFRSQIELSERIIGGQKIPPTINGSLGQAIIQAEYLPLLDFVYYGTNELKEKALPKILKKNFTKLENYIQLYKEELKEFAPEPIGNENYLNDQLFAKKSIFSNFIKLTNENEIHQKIPNYIGFFNESQNEFHSIFQSMNTNFLNELMNNRIYMIDHSAGKNFTCQTNRTCFGALALFYIQNDINQVMPLSITIWSNKPNGSMITYFPYDNQYSSTLPRIQLTHDWTFAKMAFNCLDGFYMAIRHFMENHLIFEPFRTILHRSLHDSHPISKLLLHHFKNLYGISASGFETLFSERNSIFLTTFSPSFSDIMKHLNEIYINYNWKSSNLELNHIERGVQNLPAYYYYQDSKELYINIYEFIKEYIFSYYLNENDINNDWELQSLINELKISQSIPGFPISLSTRNELIEMCTQIIFSLSVQHHTRNTYSIWHLRETLPMNPMSIWKSIPTTKPAIFNETELISYLPQGIDIYWQIALARGFFVPLSPSDYLGKSYSHAGLGDAAEPAIKKFQLELEKFSLKIQKRNVIEGSQPLVYADPQYLPYYSLI